MTQNNKVNEEDGLLSVKAVSRKLRIPAYVVYEAVAKNMIQPVKANWARNTRTHNIEWDYRFSAEAVEEFGIWLRAQTYTELQPQDDFEFGVRKRVYNYNLRTARLKLGLTAVQLGKKMGVSRTTVGHWETLRRFPSAVQRQVVAEFLGLPIDSLFPDWLAEFKLQKGPSVITDAHYSLEKALAAGIHLPSLPAPGDEAFLKEAVADVLGTLTDREQLVLRRRFGLDPDDGVVSTLEEVGREFGVTRENIRKIEAKALRKLRHPTRSRKLRDFVER